MNNPLRIRIGIGWVILTDYAASSCYYPPRPDSIVPEIVSPPQLTITIEAKGPFSFEFDAAGEDADG